jgi:hypothetical protein
MLLAVVVTVLAIQVPTQHRQFSTVRNLSINQSVTLLVAARHNSKVCLQVVFFWLEHAMKQRVEKF